jgi:hypothetical protein
MSTQPTVAKSLASADKAVIAELKSLHVDEAKKWEDLSRAISEIRQGQGREFHTLPGNQ